MNKRRFMLLMMVVCLVLNTVSVFAETYDYLTYTVENDEITITRCNTFVREVEIPSEIDGFPVRYIGDRAFYQCQNLESVVIPDSVISIGTNAFTNCTSLSEINLPPELTTIQSRTFAGCTALTSVHIPRNVNEIMASAFYGCNMLSEVKYEGDEGEWMGIRIMSGNEPLTRAEKIYNCNLPTNKCGEELTYEISEDGVLTIIGSGDMFDWEIPENAPWHNERGNISAVVIGDEVTSVGRYAFYQFTSLTELNVGISVSRIGETAVAECSSLTKVVIPKSVMEILDCAFGGCDSIEVADYESNEAKWSEICIGGGNECLTDKIRFHSGKTGKCGDEMTWAINADAVLVIEGTGEMTDWSAAEDVPWHDYKDDVTAINLSRNINNIGSYAFYGMENVTSVTVGNEEDSDDAEFILERIGDYAFYGCSGMTRIPEFKHLSLIGNSTFYGCENLERFRSYENGLEIGENAFKGCKNLSVIEYDNINRIGDGAFYGCESLMSIVLPERMEYIGDATFYGCKALTQIDMPDEVQIIGNSAFENCQRLESISGISEVTKIGHRAFKDCYALQEAVLPDGIIFIGDEAFSNCIELRLAVIPETVTAVRKGTFAGCEKLDIVSMPESVTAIEEQAFQGCFSLKSIGLPDMLREIGERAFSGCRSLTKVSIPKSVISIGDRAFEECYFESISVDSDNKNYSSKNGCLFNKAETILIKYPACKTDISYTVPDTVESIGEIAFEDCDNLTEIKLPDGVKQIGEFAFNECSGLTYIEIPDSVTEIGVGAFRQCQSLTDAKIGEGVTVISAGMFHNCESLTQVIGGVNVGRIELEAFENCMALEQINLTEKLTYIGENAFHCAGLLSITIPDSVTEIGMGAFRECTGLISVTVGDGVTRLPGGAFEHCESLTSVTFSNSIEEIDSSFGGSDKVKMVYYNGTSEDWRNITGDKGSLGSARRKYICWISFYDNEGNFLYKAKNTTGEPIFACNIPQDENEDLVKVYNDSELQDRFILSTPITQNMKLYVKKMNGTKTLVSEKDEMIETQVMFTIKGIHVREGSRVFLALYNNDVFAGIQDAVYYQGDIIFKTEIEHTSAKVMVWENNSMRPLNRAEKVQKN